MMQQRLFVPIQFERAMTTEETATLVWPTNGVTLALSQSFFDISICGAGPSAVVKPKTPALTVSWKWTVISNVNAKSDALLPHLSTLTSSLHRLTTT